MKKIVDDRVEKDREGQECGAEPVDRHAHQQHRKDRQADAEMQRGFPVHPPRRQRPLAGPLHHRVDIGFIPLVERGRSPCPQADRQDRGKADHRMNGSRRRQQSAQRGKNDQRHHARLGQRKEILRAGQAIYPV